MGRSFFPNKTMKERPILFSGPMVRALLDGSKTQTRRVVRKQFGAEAVPVEMCAETDEGWQTTGHSGRWWDDVGGLAEDAITCPFGVPGDRLWVRETWRGVVEINPPGKSLELGVARYVPDQDYCRRVEYQATQGRDSEPWRPSIHMPRWASRITLEVTGVRVERLHDITDADALAEGVDRTNSSITGYARERFVRLWTSINGNESWAADPWVWVVEFKRVTDDPIRAAREAIEL